jgi:hypothetical protein
MKGHYANQCPERSQASKRDKKSNEIDELGMFVVTTTIMNEVEQVSNGFIPDNFFDHFDLDAYTSLMFDIDEVFDTSQDLSPEQDHTPEVQELISNLYLLHSSDNENPSDFNMESWLLDSGASCVTYDYSHMSHAKPIDKVIVVGNGYKVPTVLQGSIQIQDSSGNVLNIDDVDFAPSFTKYILSMRVLLENGWKVINATSMSITMNISQQASISFDLDPLDKLLL